MVGNMRWHKCRVDATDFKRRYRQGFLEAYYFLNPDGKDDDEDSEEKEKEPSVRE